MGFSKSEAYMFTTEKFKSFRKNLAIFIELSFLSSTVYFDISLEGTKFNLTFSELFSILVMGTHYRIIL